MIILNKEAIMTADFPWIAIVVGVAILITFFSISVYTDDEGIFLIGLLLCLFVCIFGSVIEIKANKKETGRYKYEVLLDDSIQVKDFLNQYEYIDKKGDIWIIQDKEAGD